MLVSYLSLRVYYTLLWQFCKNANTNCDFNIYLNVFKNLE
jgi:hypothetical protein